MVINVPNKAQSQAPARVRGCKPMPVDGVIPRLDPTCMTARGRSQPSTRTHAKRCHGAKGLRNNNKTPSKRKSGLTAGTQNATNNNTQSHDTDQVSNRRAEGERLSQEDNKDRSPLDEGYWNDLGEHIKLNAKKEETGGSEGGEITFYKDIKQPLR